MKFSLLPFILVMQLVVIWLAANRTRKLDAMPAGGMTYISITILLLALWGSISSYLAYNNTYLQNWFLTSYPALWITFITPMIIMVPATLSRNIRNIIRAIIDITPLHWIILFEAARILAIGGVMKGLNAEFSPYYAMYIGIPDTLFGLSGIFLAYLVAKEKAGLSTIMLWNVIGAMIILPFGVVLLQMGLEGPWQVFKETPSITTIFEFPMALAPTLVVPTFVIINLLVIMRLGERIFLDQKKVSAGA